MRQSSANRQSGSVNVLNSAGRFGAIMLYVLTVLTVSCAPKKAEMPVFEGGLKGLLAERQGIRSISSTVSIEFDRDGVIMRGDGVLRLTHDTLDLRVYSLGFLVAEVTSNNGVTTSNPPFDRNRLSVLVDGLRSSFFWWSIKDPEIDEDGDTYSVSNSWKRLFINKKTMMPERQIIDLEDGRELDIHYGEPELFSGMWFPSRMRIELSKYSVELKVKTLLINPR